MKYPARLIILVHGGSHQAHFASIEEGKKVLDDFADQLGKIREFGNRDEEPIFRFQGAGAFYAVDLRKAHGASLNVVEEWTDVQTDEHLHILKTRRAAKETIEQAGLTSELNELERREPKAAA